MRCLESKAQSLPGMYPGTLVVIPQVSTSKAEAGIDKPRLMVKLSPSHSQQSEKKLLLHCYSTCFLRNLCTAGEPGSIFQPKLGK